MADNDQQQATAEAAESTVETTTEASTDWQTRAIEAEAKYKAENGIRRRLEKDLKQRSTTTTETQTEAQSQNKKGFDYAEKAYIMQNGVSRDDLPWVQEQFEQSGFKDIDQLLSNNYFQAQLKEHREQAATAKATPSGSKRSGNQAIDEVDMYLTKVEAGTLTMAQVPAEFRSKVVNARMKLKGAGKTPFYNG